MFWYFANVLSIIGSGLVITAVFRESWVPGVVFGIVVIFAGALFHYIHMARRQED